MKKLVLLSLIMSIGFWSFSQERVQTSKELRNISKTALFEGSTDEIVDVGVASNPYVSNYRDIAGEDVIGKTFYDLQSNSILTNRIHVFEDGTIGAVWTMGFDSPNFTDDRGTGYNYFDGNAWGTEPTARIESVRTGWPSIASWGANGELIVSHGPADGLLLATRPAKGTGEWTESRIVGPEDHEDLLWPRAVTTGTDNNTIHCIALTKPVGNGGSIYQDQDGAIVYNRSIDGGESWDIENVVLEGTGPDFYTAMGGDEYALAINDEVIAFVVADAWKDMFMMKSVDNGESWEKTVIWEHPYPFFDWDVTITDTFYCVDNSANIALDTEGNAHITFGISRVGHFEVGTTYNYFYRVDGIGYWNEDMPTFSNSIDALAPYTDVPDSEMVEDYNLVGWTQDVDGSGTIEFLDEIMTYRTLGISTMPSIAVDSYGTAFIAYASTTETFDNGTYNYKHIWVRKKEAAENWGAFEDLDASILHKFDECVFPVIAPSINPDNQSTYIIYQADYEPGLALDDDHDYVENRMIVVDYNLGVGINENVLPNFSVSQNTPNPANNNTKITVETETIGIINLSVSNLLGQVVYQQSVNSNASITTFDVNVSNMDSGIYFYTIEVGNSSVTKKMLVK